jgi:hypothetical protein
MRLYAFMTGSRFARHLELLEKDLDIAGIRPARYPCGIARPDVERKQESILFWMLPTN